MESWAAALKKVNLTDRLFYGDSLISFKSESGPGSKPGKYLQACENGPRINSNKKKVKVCT